MAFNERMHNKSGHRAGDGVGGAYRVRILAVDVPTTGSTLIKVQAALEEAVRAVVDNDPFKVRVVRVAEMVHTASEVPYASARADTYRRISGHDATILTFPC